MSAAAELFVRDGYEKTSVNGIVEKAGCSVGAFYGHFKSKQELATLVWAESTIEIIKESVEKGSRIKEFDAFIDYLIMRSISSYSNKLTNVLFKHISYTAEVRSNMGRLVLRQYHPRHSELTCAEVQRAGHLSLLQRRCSQRGHLCPHGSLQKQLQLSLDKKFNRIIFYYHIFVNSVFWDVRMVFYFYHLCLQVYESQH